MLVDDVTQAQNVLVVIIAGAIVDYLVGTVIGPRSDLSKAQGFVGFSSKLFEVDYTCLEPVAICTPQFLLHSA